MSPANRPSPPILACALFVLSLLLAPAALPAQASQTQKEEIPQTSGFLPEPWELSSITGLSWVEDNEWMKPMRDTFQEAEGDINVSSSQMWVSVKDKFDALGSMKANYRDNQKMYAERCSDPSGAGYDPASCENLKQGLEEQRKVIEFGEENPDTVKRIQSAGKVWVLVIHTNDIDTGWKMLKEQSIASYQAKQKPLANIPLGEETLWWGDDTVAFTYTRIQDYIVCAMVQPSQFVRPVVQKVLNKINPQTLVVTVSLPGPHVPVPGGDRGSETVPVTVNVSYKRGKPVPGLGVALSIVDPDRYPFLELPAPGEMEAQKTGDGGNWRVDLATSKPEHSEDLSGFPLEVAFDVQVFDKAGGQVAAERGSFPLGVSLFHGRTLGPEDPETAPHILKGRREPPPGVVPGAVADRLFIDSSSAEGGDFHVLFSLPRSTKTVTLLWPDEDCHLPLQYKLLVLNTPPGAVKELDREIDLLSPAEHEKRIKYFVDQFLQKMPLKAQAKGQIRSKLRGLPFLADSSASVPFYGSTMRKWTNALYLPAADVKTYWAEHLVTGDDPAYSLCFHELGHFLHLGLVETNKLDWIAKLRRGATHDTWTPPNASMKTQFYTSYAEGTADFFATLMYRFVDDNYPGFKTSLYYNPGYLLRFWQSGVEAGALHFGGCRVEGVQTRFLMSFYGSAAANRPATVFGDYLRTMFLKKRSDFLSAILPWIWSHPARTINDWTAMKRRFGGMVNPNLDDLAARFRIDPCMPQLRLLAHTYSDETKDAVQTEIDGVPTPIPGAWPGIPIAPGQTVKVMKGRLFMRMDPPVSYFSGITAFPGSEFRLLSISKIEVTAGKVVIPYSMDAKVGPNARVTHRATVFVVEATPEGGAIVQVAEGEVEVATDRGSRVVGAGGAAAVDPGGEIRDLPPVTAAQFAEPFEGMEPKDFPNPFRQESGPAETVVQVAAPPPVKKPKEPEPPPPPVAEEPPPPPPPPPPAASPKPAGTVYVSLRDIREECFLRKSKSETCDLVGLDECKKVDDRFAYHQGLVVRGLGARVKGKGFDRLAVVVAPLGQDGSLEQDRLCTAEDGFQHCQALPAGIHPASLFQGYDSWVLLPDGFAAVGYGMRVNKGQLKTLVLHGRRLAGGEWKGAVERFAGGIEPDKPAECEVIHEDRLLVGLGATVRQSDISRFYVGSAAVEVKRLAP